jgi:hypothetical protein
MPDLVDGTMDTNSGCVDYGAGLETCKILRKDLIKKTTTTNKSGTSA